MLMHRAKNHGGREGLEPNLKVNDIHNESVVSYISLVIVDNCVFMSLRFSCLQFPLLNELPSLI